MNKPTDVKSRIEQHRQKQESSGLVRADLYIPEDLKVRVKKISSQNNWKYLETLAALAALGTEVFENASDEDKLQKASFLQGHMPEPPFTADLNAATESKALFSASASLRSAVGLSASTSSYSPEVFSAVPQAATRSVMESFIEKRKGASNEPSTK